MCAVDFVYLQTNNLVYYTLASFTVSFSSILQLNYHFNWWVRSKFGTLHGTLLWPFIILQKSTDLQDLMLDMIFLLKKVTLLKV